MTATQTARGAMTAEATHGTGQSRARSTFTETKLGLKTTEFYVTVVFIAGVLLATYLDSDTLTRADGFRYASFAVAAYVISRGLAKVGVREPYIDDDNR